MKKLIVFILFALVLVIIGELIYIQFFTSKNYQTKLPNSPISTPNQPAPTPFGKKEIPKEWMNILFDPYYQSFFPLRYDDKKDRFYIDTPGYYLAKWRIEAAVDPAAMVSISTYTKDQVEELTVNIKLKGKISQVDRNKIIKGKRYLFFILTGKDGKSSVFKYNEQALSKLKLYKKIGEEEIPMDLNELKDGDTIIIEGKADLTKPPKSEEAHLGGKLIKL
jgi:hypothetical protein